MPPAIEEAVLVPGPAGVLEGVLGLPRGRVCAGRAGILCHPHPLYGGSLHNKVVHMAARALVEAGIPVLRFNFRGVGRSEGHYDEGRGETADLIAARDWLAGRFPDARLCLGGFSFGAWVAFRAAAKLAPAALLQIAPPVNHFSFAGIPEPDCPWVVLQGDADEVVPVARVREWVAGLGRPPELVVLAGAGHFFHGRLNDLRAAISAHYLPHCGC